MSSKQDQVATRTASDIERKYNFGKTFAEFIGIAEEAQKAAEKAEQTVDGLDQDKIFNILTNNGEEQGIFKKDGKIYINASYLASGVIKSSDGTVEIDLLNNSVTVATSDGNNDGKIVLSSSGLVLYGYDATSDKLQKFLSLWPGYITSDGSEYTSIIATPFLQASLHVQANKRLLLGTSSADLYLNGKTITFGGKVVSWKDNGDGTYSLIGQ